MDTENNAMHVNPKHKLCIKIDWSNTKKKLKIFQFLEKQSILMQKLLKAHYIMNKIHEYEMKFFLKKKHLNSTQIFLPKTRFLINLSPKLKY